MYVSVQKLYRSPFRVPSNAPPHFFLPVYEFTARSMNNGRYLKRREQLGASDSAVTLGFGEVKTH
jgi:hypothetical protein